MEIIDNYSYISNFSLDANFFKRFSAVKCRLTGSKHWKISKNNSFTLVNDISFFAFERESKEMFLKYEGSMLLNVVFEETENDVEEIMEQIKLHKSSMKDFIFNNSLTYYNKLDDFMLNLEPDQQDYQYLRDEIEKLKSGKKYEELSDEEIYRQENLPKVSVNVEFIAINSDENMQ